MTYSNFDDSNIIEAGFKDTAALFRWNITDICQYKCEYCYSTNDERVKECSPKLFIAKLRQLNKDFKVELIGGEPTLHSQIDSIIRDLGELEHCLEVILITNLEKDIKTFIELYKLTPKLRIDVSYHPSFSKDFYNKAIQLKDYNVNITINLDPNPRKFLKVTKMIDNFMASGIVLDLNILKDNNNWVNKFGTETIEKYLVRYKDFFKSIAKIPHKMRNGEYIILSNLEVNDKVTYKNMICTPLLYVISVDGHITNCCTQESFNLLKDDKVFQEFKCHYDKCRCDEKHQYYKRLEDV